MPIENNQNSTSMMNSSLTMFSSLVSFTNSAVCITLAAEYAQNKAVLIIIACSTIVYGTINILNVLLRNQIKMENSQAIVVVLNLFLHFLTFGSAFQFFHASIDNENEVFNDIHKQLLIAFNSLLLIAMFFNGIAIGSAISVISGKPKIMEEQNEEQYNFKKAFLETSENKSVPLKNSSQTLTPDMDSTSNAMHNKYKIIQTNWMEKEPSERGSSGNISFPSVIKHKLSSAPVFRSSSSLPSAEKSKSTQNIFRSLSLKSSIKNPLSNHFKSNNSSQINKNSLQIQKLETKDKGMTARYVTRLSAISDISKSVVNFITLQSQEQVIEKDITNSRDDRTVSMIIDDANLQTGPSSENLRIVTAGTQLEIEIHAIERINSALLPPILSPSQTPKIQQVGFVAEIEIPQIPSPLIPPFKDDVGYKNNYSTPDILEENDLESIPQIPVLDKYGLGSFNEQFGETDDLPPNVTIDMWENDKENIMKRAAILQSNILSPPFEFFREGFNNFESKTSPKFETKINFLFPFKEKDMKFGEESDFNDVKSDNISELEEYLNDVSMKEDDEESHLFENGFNQNASPFYISERTSKELSRTNTRHSPTKSIASIISAATSNHQHQRSAHNLSKILTNVSHMYSPQGYNIPTSSPPNSPTRSVRLKRIGKKLSLSNISDSMAHSFMGDQYTNNNDSVFTFNQDKRRGQSIDFTYVHNLQNNQSPSKSFSGISSSESFKQTRSNSVTMDRILRTASSLSYLQNEISMADLIPDKSGVSPIIEQQSLNQFPRRDISNGSLSSSHGSATIYPEAIMSEYDREKWNTILNLNSIKN